VSAAVEVVTPSVTDILPYLPALISRVSDINQVAELRDNAVLRRLQARKQRARKRQNQMAIFTIYLSRDIARRWNALNIRPGGRQSRHESTGRYRGAIRDVPPDVNISAQEAWVCRRQLPPSNEQLETWIASKLAADEEITEAAWLRYSDAFSKYKQDQLDLDVSDCGNDPDDIDDIEGHLNDGGDDDTLDIKRTVLRTNVFEHDWLPRACARLFALYHTDNPTDTIIAMLREKEDELSR
jgi:hypothetical protein